MSTTEVRKREDEAAFAALVDRHRRELQVHCYRMLGSFEESEDLVQETFLRAWRKRQSFEGRSKVRTWLYRIATNACLDAIERRPRRPVGGEIPWLQPYPDRLLEEVAPADSEPDAATVAKETIELAFLVAIQHLPPRPRAVLILRDVLDWPAKDTAALLETSVASVNSALQRARAAMKKHLPARRLEWAAGADPTEEERALLQRYVDATELGDADAFVDMLREDARFSMPPEPGLWTGAETIVSAWKEGGFGTEEFGDFRCRVTRANMQPAVACYVRRPGDSEHRALALDVLRIEDGRVAEIVTFRDTVFPAFEPPADALMPTFDTRSVPVAPGCERVYDEADWRDAIVFVESGEIELDCLSGTSWRFRRGDMLWLSGLPLRALCNRGNEAALLVAVSRADEFLGGGRSEQP